MSILESSLAVGLLLGSNAADYKSTIDAKNRGGIEANALLQKPGTLEGGKLLFTAGEIIAYRAFRKKSRLLAWTWVLTITGVNLAIAKHNSSVLPRR